MRRLDRVFSARQPSLRRWLKSIVAAVVLLSPPAFAQGPALWKISDSDTNLYILGSVHVLKPGTVWLNEDLRQKILSAKEIYLEVSAADQQPRVLGPLVKKYGILPQGDSLRKHLPEKVYGDLGAAFAQFGIEQKQYDSLKPWTADVVYASVKFSRAGYNPSTGVEATVVQLATTKGIPVEGLETADFQIGLLDSLTEQEATDILKADLADRDELSAVMDRLTKSWSRGDVADLANYFDDASEDGRALRKKVFTDRNASWVPKIRAIMDRPGNYVLVVGTGHLVGPESVIAMLRKAGLKVERVN
jgi:uncharacterized protein YbaP (TraB family)